MKHEELPEVKIAQSAEHISPKIERIRRFIGSVDDGVGKLIKETIEKDSLIGEGRAAKVFDLELAVEEPICDVAVKIWRNKPRRELTPQEYARIQWLTPAEEFNLQDELYARGIHVPFPITFARVGDRDVMSMEKIPGYTLKQIAAAGCKVETPWKELEELLGKIKEAGVVHRDLHPENIMLRTRDALDPARPLRGKFVIIDFGLAKKFYGTSPEPDDFRIVVNNSTTFLPNDASMLEKLKPRQPGSPLLNLK